MLDIDLNQLDLEMAADGQALIEEVSTKDIAVIGMAVNMPMAGGIPEFWDNLKSGVDCITDFPESRRRDIDPYLRINLPGFTRDSLGQYNQGAYLNEIDRFDYQFFHLSPKEAGLMDPNQRLFLQTAWHCFEDAGYGGKNIVASKTGVYLGYNNDVLYNYRHLILQADPESLNIAIPGNLTSIIASRIAYFLDLKGPSLCVDTACSSSLMAVHLACQGLRMGDCQMALVGSVKLSLFPLALKEKLGIESTDGRTKAFDDSSDGTGMGEGVAAVLLKPLYQAVKDRDHIYAVIKGSAVNQDGNSQGITAPNVAAQEEVILAAWKDAGVDPETVTYIEAHGTGTKLGDPIEVEALNRAFRRYTTKRKFCAIGTVKTNIGHLDNVAGITGLIKVAVSLQHGLIPPSLHFKTPNRRIDFESAAVYVNDRLSAWPDTGWPRRSGVSAFGLSGTNCHLVLEEPPVRQNKDFPAAKIRLFTLSAGQKVILRELLERYRDFFERETGFGIGDLCFTANTGRHHLNHRLALIVKDETDFITKIKDLLETDFTQNKAEWFSYGEHRPVAGNKESLEGPEISHELVQELTDQAMAKLQEYLTSAQENERLLGEIGHLYTKGARVAWEELYRDEMRRRISLPVYPFARTRCWVESPDSSGGKEAASAGNVVKLAGRPEGDYTEMEQEIAKGWGEVLGLKEININDDFYELGGDSILAMKLTNAINRQTGIKIEVTEVLKHSTLAALARLFEEKMGQAGQVSNIYHTIKPVAPREYYPVTAEQQRLFIANQISATGASFNMPGILKIEGPIDQERLQTAFYQLIKRHDTLRTYFGLVDGVPVQFVKDEVEFSITHEENQSGDLSGVVASFLRPFDLSQAPLLRVKLIRQAPDLHFLMFDMSHIISDGTSMGILIKDLLQLYLGDPLPPLAIQYKDYAVWQNQLADSGFLKQQAAYWVETFQHQIPVLNLPCDFPRPPVRSFEGAKLLFHADTGLTTELNQLAIHAKSTLFMVLLAAYYSLLYRYSAQEDIIIGIPVAGRPNADLEKLIGMFVKTLLMRNYPRGDKRFSDFLEEVKETAYQVYENQDYNIIDLANRLEIPTDPGRNKLYDVVFLMQNIEIPEIQLAGTRFSPYEFDPKTARNELVLQAVAQKGIIEFTLEFCTKLYKSETAERIGRDYLQVLQTVVSSPEVLLSEIRLLNEFSKPKSVVVEEVDFSF